MVYISLVLSLLSIITIFILYKKISQKEANNKENRLFYILKVYEDLNKIKLSIWEKTFNQIYRSYVIKKLSGTSSSIDDEDLKEFCNLFISRFEKLSGQEILTNIIDVLYGNSSDSYITDATRYFYDNIYDSEIYKKINGVSEK